MCLPRGTRPSRDRRRGRVRRKGGRKRAGEVCLTDARGQTELSGARLFRVVFRFDSSPTRGPPSKSLPPTARCCPLILADVRRDAMSLPRCIVVRDKRRAIQQTRMNWNELKLDSDFQKYWFTSVKMNAFQSWMHFYSFIGIARSIFLCLSI